MTWTARPAWRAFGESGVHEAVPCTRLTRPPLHQRSHLAPAVCSPLGMPVTPARCRHAAAWIWAELTSGDIREAAAYRDHTGSLVSLRETSRRFVKALPAPVAAALRSHGHALLVEAGCS
jgi:hypothetical protein